jgi:hypothetical protein
MVIGADDREIILRPQGGFASPFSAVVGITSELSILDETTPLPDDTRLGEALGSGLIIAPNHVLTAAHNVFKLAFS